MLRSVQTDGVDEVRDLAHRGLLAKTIATTSPSHRVRLTGATYAIAWPVVYARLTQKIELRRGHVTCAASVRHLAAECLDRFEDDVEAVVDDVTRRARMRINNLEGWIVSRLNAATVDGHRRRRGELGALQRPRVPTWLAEALNRDGWLIDLATQMLIWVGTTSTAGHDLWPTESWVLRHCERYGGWTVYGEADVREDIRTVLWAMRRRPQWYQRYVEAPLGRKQAPVASVPQIRDRGEPRTLSLVDADAEREQLLLALAHGAVMLIRARLSRGEPARTVVAEILAAVFGATNGSLIDRTPLADRAYDDRIDGVLCDATELDRIVATVVEIVGDPNRPG